MSFVDIAFVALRQRLQADVAAPVFRNIEATARRPHSLRYHLLTDEQPAALRSRMGTWPGVPLERLWVHPVRELPRAALALHGRLSSQATGPGPVYLWKPLLHLALPAWVERVIVLDLDIFLFSDIAELWRLFGAFSRDQLIGLAEEQCPSYQEARGARAPAAHPHPPRPPRTCPPHPPARRRLTALQRRCSRRDRRDRRCSASPGSPRRQRLQRRRAAPPARSDARIPAVRRRDRSIRGP